MSQCIKLLFIVVILNDDLTRSYLLEGVYWYSSLKLKHLRLPKDTND